MSANGDARIVIIFWAAVIIYLLLLAFRGRK